MSTVFEERTLSAALARATELYEAVKHMPGQPYASYFRQLVSSLEARNIEEAVRVRGSVPFAGMGGFGEFLEATPSIQASHKALGELIGALKLQSRYGIAREHPAAHS